MCSHCIIAERLRRNPFANIEMWIAGQEQFSLSAGSVDPAKLLGKIRGQ
jgi:hypothetical protein